MARGAAAEPHPSPTGSTLPSMTNATTQPTTTTSPPRISALPLWKVLLHDDDVNTVEFVAKTLVALTPLAARDAFATTIEAHEQGVALILTTHMERAELVQEQLTSCRLTATIERA